MREKSKATKKPKLKLIQWIDRPVVIAGVEKKYYHTEEAFQVYCVQWIRKHRPWLKAHHSANEREGGKFGLRVKLMGQSKGFPDLLVFDPKTDVKIAIEFKLHSGKVADSQTDWLDILASHGFKTAVVYTFDEFLEAIS